MIRIWHDSAMRWLPLWLTITMLNTSVLVGALLWRQATRQQNLQLAGGNILLVLWLAIAFYFVFGSVRTRCHELELTLPIPTRALWRRHVAAVFVAGALVLAGSLGVLLLHSRMISRVNPQNPMEIPWGTFLGPLLAGLLLATAAVSGVEPGLRKLTGRGSYWFPVLGCLIGVPLLLVALIDRPLLSTSLCLALALTILLLAERRLPATLRLESAEARPAAAAGDTAVIDGPVGRWQIYRTLFGLLHTAPPWKQLTPLMVYSFVALMGFVLAGGVNRWKEVEDLRFLYLPFGSYMLFAGIGVITYNLFRVDALPISRRSVLMVLILPGLVVYCLGYALGWWAQSTAPERQPLVSFQVQKRPVEIDLHAGAEAQPVEKRTMVWVGVDPGYMGLSLGNEVPTLTAPNGESHPAWSEPVLSGLPFAVYNPYNTPAETSADFEAAMLSRAIEDVYGQVIPADELRQRYFVVEDGRVVGLQELRQVQRNLQSGTSVVKSTGGFPLLEDYPELSEPSRGPETPVYMLLVLVPWLLLTALFFTALRANRSLKFVRRIYWVGLAIPMLAMLGHVLLAVLGLFSPDAGRAYLAATIRALGASPATVLLTWALCLLAIAAAYRLALRQFERAEIPVSPINCSLVDWGQED